MNTVRHEIAELELHKILTLLNELELEARSQSWMTFEMENIIARQFTGIAETLDLLFTVRLGVDHTRQALEQEMRSDFGLASLSDPDVFRLLDSADAIPAWDYTEGLMSLYEIQRAWRKIEEHVKGTTWANHYMVSILLIHADLFDSVLRWLFKLREADQDGVKN